MTIANKAQLKSKIKEALQETSKQPSSISEQAAKDHARKMQDDLATKLSEIIDDYVSSVTKQYINNKIKLLIPTLTTAQGPVTSTVPVESLEPK